MKILAMANQKGGVGKTANIIHLAFYLSEKGKKVLLIDLDTQANATYTLDQYKGHDQQKASHLFMTEFNPNNIIAEQNIYLLPGDPSLADLEKQDLSLAAKNFRDNIASLESKFDYCLIDTAPSLGVRLTSALVVSHFVVSPIELETYSIHGIKLMLTTIKQVKRFNPNINFLGMVASKVDKRNPRHVKHLEELRTAYPNLIIPQTIGLRSSVADAIAQGVPVWKIRKTAARIATKEIKSFSEYVVKKMEAKNDQKK